MKRGRPHKPIINFEAVKAALANLNYTSVDASITKPLTTLMLVDEFLEQPHRPSAEGLREFALKSILSSFITKQLSHYRQIFQLELPHEQTKYLVCLEQIAGDACSHSPDLIAWSILYYQYVRADLAISQTEYGRAASLTTRTVYRYREYAVQQLCKQLLAAEWEARQKYHRRLLAISIPSDISLIGREQELDYILCLQEQMKDKIFYITGAKGIGKTALARHLSHIWIARDNFDYIFWFNQASSPDLILKAIEDQLLPPKSSKNLEVLLAQYAILIVIDDDSLLRQYPHWQTIFQYLRNTTLVITAYSVPVSDYFIQHIPLKKLSFENSIQGFRQFELQS